MMNVIVATLNSSLHVTVFVLYAAFVCVFERSIHFYMPFCVLDTKPCELLVEKIMDRRLAKDVMQLSPTSQTSSLEAYHSVILHFAPKMTCYSFLEMRSR